MKSMKSKCLFSVILLIGTVLGFVELSADHRITVVLSDSDLTVLAGGYADVCPDFDCWCACWESSCMGIACVTCYYWVGETPVEARCWSFNFDEIFDCFTTTYGQHYSCDYVGTEWNETPCVNQVYDVDDESCDGRIIIVDSPYMNLDCETSTS